MSNPADTIKTNKAGKAAGDMHRQAMKAGLSLSKALDAEIAAFNADRSGDAAYWRAVVTQQYAEIRQLRALLADHGIDPNPEITAAIAKAIGPTP